MAPILLAMSLRFYDRKDLKIGTGSDAFFALSGLAVPGTASARLVKEAVDRVEKITPPGSSIMAIPEGMMVNYLLRRRNPTPFLQSFILSTLFHFSGGSSLIIDVLEKKKPDYIFYLKRGPEYPGPAFQMRGPGGFVACAHRVLCWP